MPSALIVDGDLGFLVWLLAILGEAGYGAIPARTISDAAKLVRGFRPRVLVINPSIRGAANFVNRLRRQNPDLKVISLADPTNRLEDITVAHRPTEITDESAPDWVELIECVVAWRPKARRGRKVLTSC